MDIVLKLLSILIRPLTVLVGLLIFKGPIMGLTELIGSVEIPGGAKIVLDRKKVEKIIDEGTKRMFHQDSSQIKSSNPQVIVSNCAFFERYSTKKTDGLSPTMRDITRSL